GVARDTAVAAQRDRVVDHAVAVVIDHVVGDLERARVDELGVAALRGRVATITAARRVAVAVFVDVLVDSAVTVVIEAVAADLAARDHLPLASAPLAIARAGLCALRAGADAGGAGRALITRALL